MLPFQIIPCSKPDARRSHGTNNGFYSSVRIFHYFANFFQCWSSIICIPPCLWKTSYNVLPRNRYLCYFIKQFDRFNVVIECGSTDFLLFYLLLLSLKKLDDVV